MSTKKWLIAMVACLSSLPAGSDDLNRKPTPVVVELFTSEGCSSCPPADALLSRLAQMQRWQGAEIIALGEHVDYWNHLGWSDRFSSAAFSQRQSRYSEAFALDSVYTPQMVIDGRYEFAGNDEAQAERVIGDEARQSKPGVITLTRLDGDLLQVQVRNAGPKAADVLLAITESDLRTQVPRGENAGRELRHSAVVRNLRTIGQLKDGEFAARLPVKYESDWDRRHLRAAAFVQERRSRHIIAATSIPLE